MSGLTSLGKMIVLVVALVVVGGIALYIELPKGQAPVACTMEAKLCPDGSAVGRTGPNCEFAPCPTPVATSTTATSTPTATTTPGGTGGGALHSGIRGTVMAGPTCPVERNPPDPACADKPLATSITIFKASDLTHAVVQTTSSVSGTFEAALPPGSYVVNAGQSMLPRCTPTSAIVAANTYTTIAVGCDTGIR